MLLNQGRSQEALRRVIDYDEKLREAYAQNLTAEFQAPSAASLNQMLEGVDAIIQLLEQGTTPDALDS